MIALCLGGARSVWADLAAAQALAGSPCLIVAANYAGIQYPGRLDGWVTLHPEWLDTWRSERRAAGRNDDCLRFIHAAVVMTEAEVVEPWPRCSSGLFAAQCALERMGADSAILCGVPMDNSGHHIRHSGRWTDSDKYAAGVASIARRGPPIRSMSGWTREIFGSPDQEWIATCR